MSLPVELRIGGDDVCLDLPGYGGWHRARDLWAQYENEGLYLEPNTGVAMLEPTLMPSAMSAGNWGDLSGNFDSTTDPFPLGGIRLGAAQAQTEGADAITTYSALPANPNFGFYYHTYIGADKLSLFFGGRYRLDLPRHGIAELWRQEGTTWATGYSSYDGSWLKVAEGAIGYGEVAAGSLSTSGVETAVLAYLSTVPAGSYPPWEDGATITSEEAFLWQKGPYYHSNTVIDVLWQSNGLVSRGAPGGLIHPYLWTPVFPFLLASNSGDPAGPLRAWLHPSMWGDFWVGRDGEGSIPYVLLDGITWHYVNHVTPLSEVPYNGMVWQMLPLSPGWQMFTFAGSLSRATDSTVFLVKSLAIMSVGSTLIIGRGDKGGIVYTESDLEAGTGNALLPAPLRVATTGAGGAIFTYGPATFPTPKTITSPIFPLGATYTDPPTYSLVKPAMQPEGTSATIAATKGDGSPFTDGNISDFKYTITLTPSPDGLRTPYIYGAQFNFPATHKVATGVF